MADKVDYCDLPVARLAPCELFQNIRNAVDQHTTLIASYIHLHTVNLMSANQQFRDTLKQFDIVIPDGIGVLWSSRFIGTPFRRKDIVTTYEVIVPSLASEAIRQGWSLFLFGAEPGVAARAMENLGQAFPGLRVAGTHHGYVGSSEEMNAVVTMIARTKPTILLVGLGQPKQEEWILRYRDQVGASIILAVGSYLDKLAKSASIYPNWVKRTQLYWLYRLLTERKRVWRRYTIEVPLFAWNVLRVQLRKHYVR